MSSAFVHCDYVSPLVKHESRSRSGSTVDVGAPNAHLRARVQPMLDSYAHVYVNQEDCPRELRRSCADCFTCTS